MENSKLFDLSKEVAIVTGSSSGLGVRFAETLAANGAAVVLVGRRTGLLNDLETRIKAKNQHALAVTCDVLDRKAMRTAFDAAEEAFGTVTVLFNNAGVAQTPGRAIDLDDGEWNRVTNTNLNATFAWSREAATRMLAAGKHGSIVNTASVMGLSVAKGQIAYATSKAGVIHFTRALGLELAHKGIRVNAIAPGWVVTDMNRQYLDSEHGAQHQRNVPMGRFALAGDLDGVALLLASNAGRYITGQTIVVDGGLSIVLAA